MTTDLEDFTGDDQPAAPKKAAAGTLELQAMAQVRKRPVSDAKIVELARAANAPVPGNRTVSMGLS